MTVAADSVHSHDVPLQINTLQLRDDEDEDFSKPVELTRK